MSTDMWRRNQKTKWHKMVHVTLYESQILELCRSADSKAFMATHVAKFLSGNGEPSMVRGTVSECSGNTCGHIQWPG